MKIELLQTVEWSKLYRDQGFDKTFDIVQVLPEVGKEYCIEISANENYAREGLAYILWRPPYTEFNGYSVRPSDVKKSFVIEGNIKSINRKNSIYAFEVTGHRKLLNLIRSAKETNVSPLSYYTDTNSNKKLEWSDAGGLWKCSIEEYIFLGGSSNEISLEAIFSIENGRLCLHYSATLAHPAFYETVVTKYFLNEYEHNTLTHLINIAPEEKEYFVQNIGETQINWS